MFAVYMVYEDAMGFDGEELATFHTEAEAEAYIAMLEAEEMEEEGEVYTEYEWYEV